MGQDENCRGFLTTTKFQFICKPRIGLIPIDARDEAQNHYLCSAESLKHIHYAMNVIKEIEVKTVLSKSNLPVSDYAVNPYVGCLRQRKPAVMK